VQRNGGTSRKKKRVRIEWHQNASNLVVAQSQKRGRSAKSLGRREKGKKERIPASAVEFVGPLKKHLPKVKGCDGTGGGKTCSEQFGVLIPGAGYITEVGNKETGNFCAKGEAASMKLFKEHS